MEEHATASGTTFGRGQFLFRVTRAEVSRLVDEQEIHPQFMHEDKLWTYRFPWPDDSFWKNRACEPSHRLITISHRDGDSFCDTSLHMHPEIKMYGRFGDVDTITIKVPCPILFPKRDDFPLMVKDDYPEDVFPMYVVGEQYHDLYPVTVFACGYCGNLFTCTKPEIEFIRDYADSDIRQLLTSKG
jgi:hypothetical protein